MTGNSSCPPELNQRAGRQHGDRFQLPANGDGADSLWERVARQDPPLRQHILIVDDCTLFRENLAAMLVLSGFPEPLVAWDLPSLVAALGGSESRIVLVNMTARGSHLLLRAALDVSPHLQVIALGASEDDEAEIVACAEASVAGYHVRTDSLEDLIALIHDVASGKSSCPPKISAILLRRLSALAAKPLPTGRELALTAREIQIVRMLELGRSNRDIAAQLNIAVHTVKNHVHSVLMKLDVSTRSEAAALSRTIRTDRGSTRRD